MNLLELSALTVIRGQRRVLEAVSLTVAAGEMVGLIGPNGAGKTTLMRAALGLLPAEGGVALGGRPLATLAPRSRARLAAYLPQEREIAWPLSVEALTALGRHPHRGVGAALTAADRAAIEAALIGAEAAAFRHRPATALSGGERARALVARALAQEAPLLLADEPIAGLDPAHAIGLMQTFRRLAAEGRGILVSLHDLSLAARHCHRLVALCEGRLVASGPPEEVLTPERLAAIYGVAAFIARDAEGPIILPTRRLDRPIGA